MAPVHRVRVANFHKAAAGRNVGRRHGGRRGRFWRVVRWWWGRSWRHENHHGCRIVSIDVHDHCGRWCSGCDPMGPRQQRQRQFRSRHLDLGWRWWWLQSGIGALSGHFWRFRWRGYRPRRGRCGHQRRGECGRRFGRWGHLLQRRRWWWRQVSRRSERGQHQCWSGRWGWAGELVHGGISDLRRRGRRRRYRLGWSRRVRRGRGGGGSRAPPAGTMGTANRGGGWGGGKASYGNSGAGGSGIVVLRWLTHP